MSILVYTEHSSGVFRKSTFEALSYACAVSSLTGGKVVAAVLGDPGAEAMNMLGKYGAEKVLHASGDSYKNFSSTVYPATVADMAKAESAKVVIIPATFTGKGFAPRVAARLKAAYVDGIVSLPDTANGFKVRKNAFSGKAFADVNVLSDVKVLGVVPNSYKLEEKSVAAEVVTFSQSSSEGKSETVTETVKSTDKVSLPEAELVVSAGRGMKGPENWGMIEELAEQLGAATACSKPVSDAHWRPHSEHVGQTGISISPNLYIAIGISGAIQHLAGVSSSKTIVVINKDAEAPFFKAADYGIVGDAFEVVPRLLESVKKYKAANG